MGVQFSSDACDTIGGLVLNHAGHVPRRNELIDIDGIRFQVLRADSRRLHTLFASRLAGDAADSMTRADTPDEPAPTE